MSPLALSLRLLQEQPDERLLALARAGHEPAFEAFVRRYRRPLLAYCRGLTSPEANAEDIVQQALLQAWRALATGAEVRDARAWLYRIVHNVAVSAVRRSVEAPAELGEAVRAIGVEQLVEERLAAREALAGLAALPELQRAVMLETALKGRSHEEVATALGLSNGSVRGLLYRARAALRAAAAALMPGPLLGWATRQDNTPRAGAAAVAGGGSAGVAGAVLKGGAIVTLAGAIAGTAVVAVHPFRGLDRPHATARGTAGRRPAVAILSAAAAIAEPVAETKGATAPAPVSATNQAAGIVLLADRHNTAGNDARSSTGTRLSYRRSHSSEPGDTSGGGDPSPRGYGGADSSSQDSDSTTSGSGTASNADGGATDSWSGGSSTGTANTQSSGTTTPTSASGITTPISDTIQTPDS